MFRSASHPILMRASLPVALMTGVTLGAAGCDGEASQDATTGHKISSASIPTGNTGTDWPDEYCGDPTSDSRIRTSSSASGDFTVTLTELPATVPSNELFAFGVTLVAADGIDPAELEILVDAGMPQHAHGMTVRPTAQRERGNGRYEVDGMLLHMPGSWELYVDVIDGPYTERVTFYVMAQ